MSDSLYALLPELTPLMQPRASPHASLSLRFNVHWTRASGRPPRVPRTALPGNRGHRRTQRILDKLEERWLRPPSGIVIGSCGPTALMDDAARAVGCVSWTDWKDVGGVESIEETEGHKTLKRSFPLTHLNFYFYFFHADPFPAAQKLYDPKNYMAGSPKSA
ncbi:hypothetical protein BGY98DRAFT_1094739 [Russula aff. rugulosa BPL654]|nr:hypothetical protein BGY98DRAFT_1094739 [Russula aff. rugulosa BPL654]